MGNYVLFYGWNRPNPGHEKFSLSLFQDFTQFLGGLQQDGSIDSFETTLLNAHGGDLNGFTIIRGDIIKLQEVQRTEEWIMLMTRAGLVMDGGGLITGVTGELVMEWMGRWSGLIPE
ncbi:MAG: hypothetical protein WA996_01455 [Candidatus Promineifilaceae bacterium]